MEGKYTNIFPHIFFIQLLSSRGMEARFKYNSITDSSILLLIMVVVSDEDWSTYFCKNQRGSGKLRGLFREFHSKHKIRIHADIERII